MGDVAEVFCTEPAPPRVHRVLVVDDHVQTRVVLTRLLERMGYVVETAEDGLRAVEAVGAIRPDIIIMDLEMPVMGGFEATERIRASSTGGWLPIVFLSATPDSAALINALNAGADDYLVKPVGYTVLRAKMRAVAAAALPSAWSPCSAMKRNDFFTSSRFQVMSTTALDFAICCKNLV